MIDWKVINRRLKEVLSKDGFNNLGTISMSYDDNCASLISSLTNTDISIELENDKNYGKIYLKLDEDAIDKNKKIFKKLIDDKDLIDSLTENYNMLFNKVSQEKMLMYESENTINENYYVDKAIILFEKIWPILLGKKIEKENTQKDSNEQIIETKEIKHQDKTNSNVKINTNTIIRLINKESYNEGVTYHFMLNNDDYHDLAIMIIKDNGPIESVVINVQSNFEYFVPTKENNAKLIIQEDNKRLYQCRIVGVHNSKEKVFEETFSIKENEEYNAEKDEHNDATFETINDIEEFKTSNIKAIIDKEFCFDHEEIFNMAMKILS